MKTYHSPGSNHFLKAKCEFDAAWEFAIRKSTVNPKRAGRPFKDEDCYWWSAIATPSGSSMVSFKVIEKVPKPKYPKPGTLRGWAKPGWNGPRGLKAKKVA